MQFFVVEVSNSAQYTVLSDRLRRSKNESFYIIDTFLVKQHFPTITVLGSTGNAYFVTFSPTQIRCSCPDCMAPCKHMLFLFELLGLNPTQGNFCFPITECLSRIRRMRPFHSNRLDIHANELCCTFLFKKCALCIRTTGSDEVLYACNQCVNLVHSCHVRQSTVCPFCGDSWRPFKSSLNGGYRNFSLLLRRLQYPVHLPTDNGVARPVQPEQARPPPPPPARPPNREFIDIIPMSP